MDRWNFRNVKRNILSSSRGRNAQRSGNPWRQQRRNGKSWRNTAAERKSLFLRRWKEAESEDKKIFKMLESLDFYFGGKSYKVGEAGLMFCYEIGIEGRQLYIVALTENFGTIIFYVPEEVEEKIRNRVQQFPYTLNDYLSLLIEFKDLESTLKPYTKFGLSINEAAVEFNKLLNIYGSDNQNAASNLTEFSVAYDKKIQASALVPNNWLKMHGFPMRRKGRGKKKRE